MNGDDPAHYRVPTERAVIAQELLLFENGGAEDSSGAVDAVGVVDGEVAEHGADADAKREES